MTGNRDSSFELIYPDDAVDCAATEAASRRRYNLTLDLLGTLADSGLASFADDRRLFMAWQATRLLAPSWNEPPDWFIQRHLENKHACKAVRPDGERDSLLPCCRSNPPTEYCHPQVAGWVMSGFVGGCPIAFPLISLPLRSRSLRSRSLRSRSLRSRRSVSVVCGLGARPVWSLVGLVGHMLQIILQRYAASDGQPSGRLVAYIFATSADHVDEQALPRLESNPGLGVLEAA